jgi:hypothetical protein
VKRTLDYAPPSRLSRLCVFSLPLSIACCPLLVWLVIHDLTKPVAFVLPILSAVVAVAAIIRVRESNGLRHGVAIAACALGFSLFWIVALLALHILAALLPPPPPE